MICGICQLDISDKSLTTPCKHDFCQECFFEWINIKSQCPICRHNFCKDSYQISNETYNELRTNIIEREEVLFQLNQEITYNTNKYMKLLSLIHRSKQTIDKNNFLITRLDQEISTKKNILNKLVIAINKYKNNYINAYKSSR